MCETFLLRERESGGELGQLLAASNLRVKGPDKRLQIDAGASGNILNGAHLSMYFLPTLTILDLGGD